MARFWTCHWRNRYWRDDVNVQLKDSIVWRRFRGLSTGDHRGEDKTMVRFLCGAILILGLQLPGAGTARAGTGLKVGRGELCVAIGEKAGNVETRAARLLAEEVRRRTGIVVPVGGTAAAKSCRWCSVRPNRVPRSGPIGNGKQNPTGSAPTGFTCSRPPIVRGGCTSSGRAPPASWLGPASCSVLRATRTDRSPFRRSPWPTPRACRCEGSISPRISETSTTRRRWRRWIA